MPTLEKQQEREYETTLRVGDFIGRNTYGQHSSLQPGEFRELENLEVYPKYLKTRRGSQLLGNVYNNQTVMNRITWDVGDAEYLLFQVSNKIQYYKVAPTAGTTIQRVVDLDGADWGLGGTGRADLFLDGDKLFVMHEDGNYIIHWDATAGKFKSRALGLDYPFISAITAETGTGTLVGDYVWAVELCYLPDDLSDISYSSPNRIQTNNKLAKLSDLDDEVIPTIEIQATELEATGNDYWTHIRLWRTLRLDIDDTDTANPIDSGGVKDELYLVAEITKAEIENVGLTSLDQSADKPAGNEFVQAGTVGSTYTITDTCTDEYLDGAVFIDSEKIELVPMPAAKLGVSHANRIFISSVQATELNNNKRIDDDSKNDLWYSNFAGGPYSELTSALQIIPTNRDGQEMKRLISFEKDLIGIKESKTIRLADGFVDLQPETVDHRIGIKEPEYVEFIPGLGLCALTNDYDDFAIFGFDQIWRKTFNGIEIARAVREDMRSIVNNASTRVSFIYINGKILFSTGTGANVFVLNVESKRGWSKFNYPISNVEKLFVFGGGRRAGMIQSAGKFVEIEVEDLDTDVKSNGDTQNIVCTYDTWMWQSGDGADVLEQQWLSIMAYAEAIISGAPYVNGLAWPDKDNDALAWTLVGQDGDETELADREYRLYIKPQTMGTFKWMPPVGNYIYHRITTEAPAIFKVHKLRCVVDTDGLSFGGFDPYQLYSTPYGPAWDTVTTITETGDSGDATITETGSGADDTITETGE